jgi:hypothetical protein
MNKIRMEILFKIYYSSLRMQNYDFELSGNRNVEALESDGLTTVKSWQNRRLNS